ncbi:serpin B6 [Nannizzia gypsea CBS 118893]|uniref:Serpin B6 n=1 Tax=Arthroderma gypseum (strain ATCC MYA-4604 / CBS 118893) TaxID=535722 RepID=E5QYC0_ARTGP|nr:serpin B6 [Nannizzia gypsea CBS 118893]EFQ97212.1 serpin B6 [Nannizzia gypsea CBS 118893]
MTAPSAFSSVSFVGLKLLQQLCGKEIPDGGIALSPASIGIAMAMLAGAAIPSEAQKMCQSMGFGDKPEELDAVHHHLKHCNDTTAAANAIFAEKGTVLHDEYTNFLERFEVCTNMEFPRLVDGRDAINGWISDNTMGMINNMISNDSLARSHLVLINALAFKGIWKEKFDPKNTASDFQFKVTDSDIRRVDMMFRFKEDIYVHNTSKYRAVKLPYEAKNVSALTSFTAYLPRDGVSVQEVMSCLPSIQEQNSFRQEKIDRFGFPKMDMSYSTDIFPLFEEIGLHIPSDFPKMGEGGNIVSSVLHNTAVSVDEQGTRAAASTAVMMTRDDALCIVPGRVLP